MFLNKRRLAKLLQVDTSALLTLLVLAINKLPSLVKLMLINPAQTEASQLLSLLYSNVAINPSHFRCDLESNIDRFRDEREACADLSASGAD